MISSEFIFFACFAVFICGMLMLDLGVFSRKNHVISFKEAAIWSGVWVALAVGFYFILRTHGDWIHGIDNFAELKDIVERYELPIKLNEDNFQAGLEAYRYNMSLEYITMYLLEYTLSADNIFVIIMVFSAFGVKEKYYKKVLFWGILGALIMRFIFIWVGSELVARFHWILWIFGGFLIYTGVKSFFEKEDDEQIEPQKHPVVKFASKYFSVYPRYVRDRFFIRRQGTLMITPLFLVLLIIEFTDLIFAVDSIPAAFSVSRDRMVIYFANIFAIMGLRSMFFFLSNIMHIFHYLKIGLSFLLTYIGIKMIFAEQLKEIGFKNVYSIFVILGILTISVVASLVFPVKKELVEKAET
ncbi:MAG: TerC/Alx family metal homeostasis membrane protein [Thermonemataceae bacterium]